MALKLKLRSGEVFELREGLSIKNVGTHTAKIVIQPSVKEDTQEGETDDEESS